MGDTAAETHADTRMVAGFGIDAMLTEYRALRASVLRMWADSPDHQADTEDLRQLTRFNEAIDQAITESVARYTEQIDRSTNLFMGMLGHDIRNPLGTIRLATEVMTRSGQLSATMAKPIVNAAKRIQSIVELIIDFSRAQSQGVMPVSVRPGELSGIFANVVDETRVRHPSTPIVLKGAELDTHGQWDEGRMGQLLSNLLENAILYGASGTPVTVVLTAEADDVAFSVHNVGEPIPLEDRERIFEPRSARPGDRRRPALRAWAWASTSAARSSGRTAGPWRCAPARAREPPSSAACRASNPSRSPRPWPGVPRPRCDAAPGARRRAGA